MHLVCLLGGVLQCLFCWLTFLIIRLICHQQYSWGTHYWWVFVLYFLFLYKNFSRIYIWSNDNIHLPKFHRSRALLSETLWTVRNLKSSKRPWWSNHWSSRSKMAELITSAQWMGNQHGFWTSKEVSYPLCKTRWTSSIVTKIWLRFVLFIFYFLILN